MGKGGGSPSPPPSKFVVAYPAMSPKHVFHVNGPKPIFTYLQNIVHNTTREKSEKILLRYQRRENPTTTKIDYDNGRVELSKTRDVSTDSALARVALCMDVIHFRVNFHVLNGHRP